jgi:hypothetical protein
MEPGKSNCETCKRLVRLCGGLDFFPQDQEVQSLLVERLHMAARDHQHAKSIIYRWLDTQTAAPKVADFLKTAAEMRPARGLPDACGECKQSGGYWVFTDRGADRCRCPRGQALSQMDRAASRAA